MDSEYSAYSASRFSAGPVLGLTFSCLGKNPGLFLGLAIIVTLPNLILANYSKSSPSQSAIFIFSWLLKFFTSLFEGAVAFGVYQILREQPVTLGKALAKGLARLLYLVIVSFIFNIGVTIGLVLLIIPGLILICMWIVAIPACVVESLGPIDSLRRSAVLTQGYRWQIFGLILSYFIAALLIGFGANFFFLLLTNDPLSATLGSGIIGILPTAIYATMLAVIYYQLRSVKEGVAIDRLTNVFD